MFSDVEVGESVYCLLYGEGKVIDICKKTLSIKVQFPDSITWYYFSGHILKQCCRTLYWSKPSISGGMDRHSSVTYKNVNGFKVSDISVYDTFETASAKKKQYWKVNLSSPNLCTEYKAKNKKQYEHLVLFELLYPYTTEGKVAAVAHASALLGSGVIYEL